MKKAPRSKVHLLLILTTVVVCGASLYTLFGSTTAVMKSLTGEHEKKKANPTTTLADIPVLPHAEYNSIQERDGRSDRFPSILDRVKLYMGTWFVPPCHDHGKIPYQYVTETVEKPVLLVRELDRDCHSKGSKGLSPMLDFEIEKNCNLTDRRIMVVPKDLGTARLLCLDIPTMMECSSGRGQAYCDDMREFMIPTLQRLPHSDTPTILQFGDTSETQAWQNLALNERAKWPYVPSIQKFRASYTGGLERIREMTRETCISGRRHVPPTVRAALPFAEAVIWRMTSNRHYGEIPGIPELDVPWSQKQNKVVFRGALTGMQRDGFSLRHMDQLSHKENCQLMHRCRLVFHSAGSALVDAALVRPPDEHEGHLPDVVEGVTIYGQKLGIDEMLKYKAIIMLEGNDISSGLKWALYSNSVVMTQVSTKTSWALEELLEPWVHFVPLNKNLSDVEEKMQWVIDHDQEAQAIAKRGRLWIMDLLYHPDAAEDDRQIYEDILMRFRAHFVQDNSLMSEVH